MSRLHYETLSLGGHKLVYHSFHAPVAEMCSSCRSVDHKASQLYTPEDYPLCAPQHLPWEKQSRRKKTQHICCSVELVGSFSSSHTTNVPSSMVLPDLKIRHESVGRKESEKCSRGHLLQICHSKEDACCILV